MKKLVSIFQSGKDTISCKRVCGMGCIVTACYCAIAGVQCTFIGEIIAAGVVLLGAETAASVFNKNTSTEG